RTDSAASRETAETSKTAMSKVRGVVDLAVFTSLGQPTLRIDIDRKAAARYGLAPGDAQVQRPLALVVVGGILLTPILVLIILPVLIDVFSRRTRPDVVDQRAIEPV